jgi:hypothetical protein
MKRDDSCLMAIYDRPREFPSSIVVRRWAFNAEGALAPDPNVLTFDINRLSERGATKAARAHCNRMGLRFLPRNAGDDPVLMETWQGRPVLSEAAE